MKQMKRGVAKFVLVISMFLSAYSVVGAAAAAHEPQDGMPVPTCGPSNCGDMSLPMPMPTK